MGGSRALRIVARREVGGHSIRLVRRLLGLRGPIRPSFVSWMAVGRRPRRRRQYLDIRHFPRRRSYMRI